MKKILSIIFFLILSVSVFSQSARRCLINDLQWYSFQKQHIDDNNFHSSVKENYIEYNSEAELKPLFLPKIFGLPSIFVGNKTNFSNDSIHKFLTLLPVFTNEFSLDASQKKMYKNLQYGISTFGVYKDKIKFNADIFYGISSFSDNLSEKIEYSGIIPGFGKYLSEKNGTYSYFSANGSLTYSPAKYINFEAGRGKNFLGHGYRSLLLSDNSNSYPFFKSTVDVWRIKYVYMISKLKDFDSDFGLELRNKYSVEHYLSANITKWLNFNFFEAVVASPIDSLGAKRGFDVNYLNPVLFLRPVEAAIGSSDNMFLGFGGELKLFKYQQFYAQVILDEFFLSEIKARNGWWGNKHGLQLGYKSFKAFFIKDLYALFEINLVRPYTYSHLNSIRNWGNYYQPMAHQLGANFKEAVVVFRYQFENLYLTANTSYAEYGTNSDSLTVGQDIYYSYGLRAKEFDNFIGQGVSNKLLDVELKASYLIVYNWNLYLEMSLLYRQHMYNTTETKNVIFSLGLKTMLYN